MRRVFAYLIIFLLVLALGLALWGVNFSPDAALYEAELTNLPEEFDGFTIAVVSDVHGRRLPAVTESVRAAYPDLIAVTGDLVDDPEQLSDMSELLAELCAIAPLCYVTGNHEWASGTAESVCALVNENGGTALRNEYLVLKRGDAALVIAGADDPNGHADMKTHAELRDEIAAAVPGAAVVMLYHRNRGFEDLGADVLLCGHGHGSPLHFHNGALVREEYRSGAYLKNNTAIITSRGIGYSLLPLRLTSRIHLPIVKLTKA